MAKMSILGMNPLVMLKAVGIDEETVKKSIEEVKKLNDRLTSWRIKLNIYMLVNLKNKRLKNERRY